MAFHQTMQWREEGEMKLGGKMVPDSRDLDDYSEEANLALIRGWRGHFEQVNSIMGRSQWLWQRGAAGRRAGHRKRQTKQWAGPEVMDLNRPEFQVGAALKGNPWHNALHDGDDAGGQSDSGGVVCKCLFGFKPLPHPSVCALVYPSSTCCVSLCF